MRGEAAQALQLGVAVVAVTTVVHFLWSRLRRQDSPPKAAAAAPASPAASGGASKTGDDGQALEDGVWIYFGSQSGTAEGFSRELGQEAKARGLRATVVDMEDFRPEDFARHKVAVLVLATYGEGDPTDNAVEFARWVQDDALAADTLKGMSFAVMGLGSSSYVNFNSCGRAADKHLERLGAARIHARGEGDDAKDIQEDFEQWKESGLWPALQQAVGPDGDHGQRDRRDGDTGALETAEAVLAGLQLRGEVRADAGAAPVDPLVQAGGADVLGKWYFGAALAPVSKCEELRQVAAEDAGETTKHLELDTGALPALDWRTADNLEVLPRNPDEDVDWFAGRLGVGGELDSSVAFVRAEGVDKPVKMPFPSPCSVRNALGLYCDLAAAPPRAAARRIAAFARDPEERAALEKLLQDRQAYQWLTGGSVRITAAEFFELFLASAELDLGTFLQLCPRQRSRPYTIASSSREDPKTIGLCVGMVQEALPDLGAVIQGLEDRGHTIPGAAAVRERLGEDALRKPRTFRGACSTMLCTRVAAGDGLWVSARASSFRLPPRATAPIVMVGAGTGVAPFRAFAREFAAEGGARRKTALFFGCTGHDKDFLYREEFKEALAADKPALAELVTAFSREGPAKVYVQHRLRERAEEIAGLVRDGGYVYVCGAAAMGRAVREELCAALGDSDGAGRLQAEGRLVEELW